MGVQDMKDSDIRAVLAALPDLVAVVDSSGAARWVNRRGMDLCGIRSDEVDGLTLWDVLDPEDHEAAALGLHLNEDNRPPGQIDIVRRDGTRVPIEVYNRPVVFDGETCALLVGRPVDHRIEEQIAGLVQGEPFEEVVEKAVRQICTRWTGHLVCLSTVDRDGRPMLFGDDLPDLLSPQATTPDGSLPWERAARDLLEVHVGLDELDATTAEAARAFGVDSCGVAPLADPLGRPACLVTWHRADRPVAMDRVWLRSSEVNLLRLALVRRAAHLALEVAAATDPLTGLRNRKALFDQLEEPDRTPSGRAVLFLDLDGFKPINDTYGHGAGDRLLNLVARRLESITRGDDLVTRMGGDEFAVLVSSLCSHEQAMAVAQRVIEVMADPFEVAPATEVTIDVSVGVAVDLAGTERADQVVHRADAAMYAAKRAPGSRIYLGADAP